MNKKRAEWIAACPIRRYASELGVSLGALCRATGMNRQSMARWLRGQPPGPRGRGELARVMGRSESQIFDDFASWLASVPMQGTYE